MDTIFRVTEGFLTAAFAAAGIALDTPFVRMTYDEAIRNYGIDKPDMRLPAMVSLTDILTPELRTALKIEQEAARLGFVIPGVGELIGTARKTLSVRFASVRRLWPGPARRRAAETNAAFAPLADGIEDPPRMAATFSGDAEVVDTGLDDRRHPQARHARHRGTSIHSGSTSVSAALRLELGAKFADKHRRFEKTGTAADFKFAWVTDFPMYEWNEESKTWDAAHHPFTSPHEDDIQAGRLDQRQGGRPRPCLRHRAQRHRTRVRLDPYPPQGRAGRDLPVARHEDEEAHERFGFFLDALEYGTPPHGGIALGLDRIVMILAGADQPARGHRLPQDRQGHRPHGRRTHPGQRPPAPRPPPPHRHPQLGAQPVFDLQTFHTLELANIVRHQNRVERECMSGDEHVVLPDDLASPLKVGAQCCICFLRSC